MKNLLKIWLLAFLLPVFVSAQKLEVIGRVDMSGYYTRQQSDSMADAKIKAALSGVIIKPPVVVLDDCKRGPTITNITAITQTSLTGWFDGEDVFGIYWKITRSKTDTVRIRWGSFAPEGPNPSIIFGQLDPGSYVLWYSGYTCKGESNRAFTIPKLTGEGGGGTVNPPVITDPVGDARVIPQVVPYPGIMKLQRTAVKGGWLYTDLRTRAETGLQDGFYIFYEVNGKRIVTEQLKDYFVSESAQAVSITKTSLRNGISEKWMASPAHGGTDANQGYFQPGGVYAVRASDVIVGNNALYPPEYDPYTNQRVQFTSILPNAPPRESFIYAMPKGETPIDVMIYKGVNRFSGGTLHSLGEPLNSNMLRQGYGYNEVPISPTIFGWTDKLGYDDWVGPQGKDSTGRMIDTWPFFWNRRYLLTPVGAQEPMTFEEGRQAGRNFSTANTLTILETSEQSHAIGSHWSFVRGFSEEWHSNLFRQWEGSGKTILTAWNYFSDLGVSNGWGTSDERKALFRKPLSQWPGNAMLPGGTLEKFTAYCVPMYYGFTDAGYDLAYELALQYYVQKKTGKHCIVFPAATLENNPNGIVEWRLPEGKYYHKDKLPQDPSIMITAGALSRIFCKALVPWMIPSYSTKPFRLYNYYISQGWQQKGLWVPNGNSETQIQDINSSPIITDAVQGQPSQGITDNLAFGKNLAEQTFGVTEGGTDEWLRFRVDGSKWVEPVNDWADDAINAKETEAPIVFSRRKDRIISILICNPKAKDSDKHVIEYQIQGKTYTKTIAGITPYMFNLTY